MKYFLDDHLPKFYQLGKLYRHTLNSSIRLSKKMIILLTFHNKGKGPTKYHLHYIYNDIDEIPDKKNASKLLHVFLDKFRTQQNYKSF